MTAALLFAALVFATTESATPPGPATVADPAALADELARNLEKTVARADADIVSEVEAGGYRIGLVLGPARSLRPQTPSGRFLDADKPDPALTFVGIVLREPRTKRFLPSATVRVNLEIEGGGENELYELAGQYPVYGSNFRIPKPGTVRGPDGVDDLRAITVTISPPAYHRHAEMLGAFTGEAVARFETAPRSGAKGPPWHVAKDPQPPKPVASDWTIGDDLRQAVGESRQLVRNGPWVIGFIAEGPEPVWLWKGAQHPPEHLAVQPNHNTHLEAVLLHVPTGLSVTGASVAYQFWRRPSPTAPREEKRYLLRPLLAEFYHYGLTADVPPGEWNVVAQVVPPRIEGWGEGPIPVPAGRFGASFSFVREAPTGEGPEVEAARLSQAIRDAADQYKRGEREAAAKAMTDAFFAFEGGGLDITLRAADPTGYKAVEKDWIDLNARMAKGTRSDQVEAEAIALADRLQALAKANAPERASPGSTFVQSFLVLLREGFEAILVLGLLVAVLRKTGRAEAVRVVWGGAIAALLASALLAVAFLVLFKNVAGGGGRAREAFEGFTLLLATIVLFFTSFWLISRVEGRRWAAFVKQQIQSAVTAGRRRTIAALAFLVVFREGAETVLLYASLFAAGGASTSAIVAGIGVASVALVGIFIVSMRGGAALPVRPFFGITGALLYVLAFKFAGDAIFELQAAGLVPVTPVDWIPDSSALQSWLGIYARAETAALQGVLLLAVAAGLAWTVWKRPVETQGAPAG